jgi:hypothetical protein
MEKMPRIQLLQARRTLDDTVTVVITWMFEGMQEGIFLRLRLPDIATALDVIRQVEQTAIDIDAMGT